MPDPKTQRYLGWIAFFGLFASCFGCGLYTQNQISAGTAFLVLAWVILVPVFVYLIGTRRRLKKATRAREAQRTQELDALASLGKSLEAEENKEPNTYSER